MDAAVKCAAGIGVVLVGHGGGAGAGRPARPARFRMVGVVRRQGPPAVVGGSWPPTESRTARAPRRRWRPWSACRGRSASVAVVEPHLRLPGPGGHLARGVALDRPRALRAPGPVLVVPGGLDQQP